MAEFSRTCETSSSAKATTRSTKVGPYLYLGGNARAEFPTTSASEFWAMLGRIIQRPRLRTSRRLCLKGALQSRPKMSTKYLGRVPCRPSLVRLPQTRPLAVRGLRERGSVAHLPGATSRRRRLAPNPLEPIARWAEPVLNWSYLFHSSPQGQKVGQTCPNFVEPAPPWLEPARDWANQRKLSPNPPRFG